MKIRDLGTDFELISDSQDINYILCCIGYDGDADDYGCLFARICDGEIEQVFGCWNSVPWLNSHVDELFSPRTDILNSSNIHQLGGLTVDN